MWRIIKTAAIFVFLLLCSMQDIREKRISVKMLVLTGCLFLAMSLLFEDLSVKERIYNISPGLTACLIAFLTREQIGYGDAACLMVLGSMISADVLLGALMAGLILLSVCSILLLAGRKADRRTTLPFLPFLSAGMLVEAILKII